VSREEETNKDVSGQFPRDEDKLLLKSYVRSHPGNRMAWYLLGKEYQARGEPAKAAYCFLRAGEVYEAFEQKPFPAAPSLAGQPSAGRRARRLRALAAACLLLLLALAPPGGGSREAAPSADAPAYAPPETPAAVYYLSGSGRAALAAGLAAALLPAAREAFAVIAAPARSEDGRWRLWRPAPRPLASVGRAGGQAVVRYYDEALCGCRPGDPRPAAEAIASRQQREEAMAVLRSAMAAYRQRYGALPDKIDALIRPYPDNVLSGYTPLMEALFAEAERRAPGSDAPAETGGAASALPSGEAPAGLDAAAPRELLAAPLGIRVDKDSHRLAVVSGDVILRVYPVGLGGGRTPEGGFAVSKKVRNPRGPREGEYGTRGMVLSDSAYAIHGTDKPESIGRDDSQGCIRMREEDLEELFDLIPTGTAVYIGRGDIPAVPAFEGKRFRLPAMAAEETPDVIYHWLG